MEPVGDRSLFGLAGVISNLTGYLLYLLATFPGAAPKGEMTVLHLPGYLLNMSILIVIVDRVGLPHQAVQAVAIVIVAVFLFFLMERFVFARGSIGQIADEALPGSVKWSMMQKTLECPGCRFATDPVGGFPPYAPELSRNCEGFHPEYFSDLAAIEANNFWFRSRNDLIVWALGKYFPEAVSFLEIGCGTGFVLSGIAKAYPRLALFGGEVYSAGLGFAAGRVPRAQLMQMDARTIPFEEHFDAVGAFDVLEHVEEDEKVLARMRRALKPGGGLLLTVPQHRWLWSPFDIFSCHVRRYSRSDLHEKLSRAGFEILRSTSFVSLLLPAMFASRFYRRGLEADHDPLSELRLAPRLDRMLVTMLRVENQLIKAGISFPFGGSRLVAARRA